LLGVFDIDRVALDVLLAVKDRDCDLDSEDDGVLVLDEPIDGVTERLDVRVFDTDASMRA
jgi:hypothetical protein